MKSLADVKLIGLVTNIQEHGELYVAEVKRELPFPVQRIFIVCGEKDAHRGHHAHIELTQILICTHGICQVTVDDSENKKTYCLDSPGKALIIPPGLWAEQVYAEVGTVLTVLCDLPYDEADYIRNYDDFISYRKEYVL